MSPSEVASSYDILAPQWAGDEFERSNGLAQHRRALQFVRERRHAIDVGCGSSGRFFELMLAEGFAAVEGLDVSREMIRLARRRFPQVCFRQMDACLWRPSVQYDFITAWDSIWHVPLQSQGELLGNLCSALAPGGVMIFSAGGLDDAGETWDSHMGVPMYHATIGIREILRVVDRSNCICKHLEFDQYPELHLFLIVQKYGVRSGNE